jgi:hypothetical protein
MMGSLDQMLSMLLDGAVETLDIPPHMQDLAVERYEHVAHWLADNSEYDGKIYPQGSFRLGTVVRPAHLSGEFDIDLVFRLAIAKADITQAALTELVGKLLTGYMDWAADHAPEHAPAECAPRRRCWTLTHPIDGFHLDVLPSIRDLDKKPTGILLPDRELHYWQHSDPIAYVAWFRTRSQQLLVRLAEMAHARSVDVDSVPEWQVRSTLQRLVQVLKWHASQFFARNPDDRPPSILITTLAALAYDGDDDLFRATRAAVDRMPSFVTQEGGRHWVANPAQPEENFADKWNDYPERREAFYAWMREITTTLAAVAAMPGRGLQVVAARLAESFGAEPIRLAATRIGENMRTQRDTGKLYMGSTGLLTASVSGVSVTPHTFHGHHVPARSSKP